MLKLKRKTLDNCSLGKLYYLDELVCYTVEKPYLSNEPFESCIPPGDYQLRPHNSDKYPDTFYLLNTDLGVGYVEGESVRYGILIHIANFPDEVVGCIGVGMKPHPSTWGVASSRAAMVILRNLINHNKITKIRITQ